MEGQKTPQVYTGIGTNVPESREEIEEDILEVLYRWECTGRETTKRRLAEYFGMSGHEVTGHIKKMATSGYLTGTDTREKLKLTELGRVYGQECHYRHTTLTDFLQMLGLEEEEAEKDACRIEHVVGERMLEGITNFMVYGDMYERTFTDSSLRIYYEPGEYPFLMGLYSLDDHYPRAFATESGLYSDTVTLSVTERESGFYLHPEEPKEGRILWYKYKEQWEKAEAREQGDWIPAEAFSFTISPGDMVKEGYVLAAVTEGKEKPDTWKCRELNVHIW